MEVEMEIEVEGEVEVEEVRGRIEYKVVEQLKRWSSKHRPNYLTFCTSPTRLFSDFFLFLFLFLSFKGEEGKNDSSTQLVVNTDIFQGGGEKNSTTTCTYTRICMYVIDRRRSGVLRISSEEIDKKLMYLE